MKDQRLYYKVHDDSQQRAKNPVQIKLPNSRAKISKLAKPK